MDSTGYECAFFSGKLGMLFNTHDSKLTIVGLDSHLYGQTSLSNSFSPQIKPGTQNALDNEATKDIYQDAITLAPCIVDGETAVDNANLNKNPNLDKATLQTESKQEAAEKFLEAFANFDDDGSPRSGEHLIQGSGECDCIFGETDETPAKPEPIPTVRPDSIANIDFNLSYTPQEEVLLSKV